MMEALAWKDAASGATDASAGTEAIGSAYARHTRPRLAEMLAAIGIDVVYHRAEGDHLWYRDRKQRQVRVLDLLGGFGATLFGHNHPELVATLRAQIDARVAVHAQASVRAPAAQLAVRLSAALGRWTGRSYVVTFANSGAEAVEAALKHALFEAATRRDRILGRLEQNVARISREVLEGRIRFCPQAADHDPRLGVESTPGQVVACLEDFVVQARVALGQPAILLAIENAFHGKTGGALRLMHNPVYRGPWAELGAAQFIGNGDSAALRTTVERHTVSYNDVDVDVDGVVQVRQRRFCGIGAIFAEPVQGEGGVRRLDPEFLKQLRREADDGAFPLVFDEIQSGMGRTGTFVASERAGVAADYVLLSKSLGAGLVKIAAVLIDEDRYQREFGYLHTSTFAEDDLSCAVALSALDLLERDDGRLMKDCEAKGDYFLRRLHELAVEFPDVVAAVRGHGLMLGVELRPQNDSPSPMIRLLSQQRLLTFLATGYLLHESGIRVAPTLSAHGTIRIQPSAYIQIAQIDECVVALRRLLIDLRTANVPALWRFAMPEGTAALQEADLLPVRRGPRGRLAQGRPVSKVGFLVHFRTGADLRLFDRGFRAFSAPACEQYFAKARCVLEPFLLDKTRVESSTGDLVELVVVALPFTADQASAALAEGRREPLLDLIRCGLDIARAEGAVVVGCGGYTSILSDNCRSLADAPVAVTSGNSLTVAAAVEALDRAARTQIQGSRRLGIVGATGNIGAMLAEVACELADEVVLVGRPGAAARLGQLAGRLARPALVATDLAALTGCNLIISASNSPRPVICADHIGPQAVVICDVAVPADVAPEVASRANVRLIRGGIIRLPKQQDLGLDSLGLDPGRIYACMAESLLLGLSGVGSSFSVGPLQAGKIRLMRTLAQHHGFEIDEDKVEAAPSRGEQQHHERR
jgi:acetylornithine/succinyldiaminopimelate/putrescine aminotransferase/predicted amino acid dehydrogenase